MSSAFGVGGPGQAPAAEPFGPACPCGSGDLFADCCEPIMTGGLRAPTAERLMRSRFTAHVRGDLDHLFRSWHPRTRPVEVRLDRGVEWVSLRIEATTGGGADDAEGVVEFIARYRDAAEPNPRPGVNVVSELHERSSFVQRAGRWVYLGPV